MTKPAVHISKMTGKLEGFQAISTNTITNEYCQRMHEKGKETGENICGDCYSQVMLKTYRKNMQNALQRNSDILSTRPLEPYEIPRINAAMFRFNAHGELINMQHVENIMAIVKDNPWVQFALWTKRVDLIMRWLRDNDKPTNLNLIYSNPKKGHIMSKPPKGFDKTFNNVQENEHVEQQNCTGQKCKDCRICYTINEISTIVEKVKKY